MVKNIGKIEKINFNIIKKLITLIIDNQLLINGLSTYNWKKKTD